MLDCDVLKIRTVIQGETAAPTAAAVFCVWELV